MAGKLENKVAIVTGGSRDIGKAISIKLAKEGAKVAINFLNNEEHANSTLKEIQDFGGTAMIVKADVTNSNDVRALVQNVRDEFGGAIDILVNNAGGLVSRKSLLEMDEDFFNKVMHLNLNSTFLMTQACAQHMGEGAAIVNIASQAGRDGGGPGAAAYATSKGAVMTFTRSMAKELGPKNIRVNAVCPGMISSTFHDVFTKDEVRTKVAGSTPLQREGAPQEVADFVSYLASSESSFIHGACLDINGGLLFS